MDSEDEENLENFIFNNNYIGENNRKNYLTKNSLVKNNVNNLTNENLEKNKSQNLKNNFPDFKKNLIFSFDNNQTNNIIDNNDIDKNILKLRELLSNFMLLVLKEYSLEEISKLKFDINILYSYLLLPTIENTRKKFERKVIYLLIKKSIFRK